MIQRALTAVMILAAILCLTFSSEAAERKYGNGNGRPEKDSPNWIIYWYACGTDIESGRILFDPGTDLLANKIVLAEPTRRTGDVTRCIRELERADISSGKVKVIMQAGGTMVWGHEKLRSNNALIDVGMKSDKNWSLETPGHVLAPHYKLVSRGTLARYVFSDKERNWKPRKTFSFEEENPATDMGDEKCLEEFLRYGKNIERELYPDGNVRRIFIFRDHGGGSLRGVCFDMYTSHMIPLQGIKDAFHKVWGTSPENLKNPPFEVIGFDMCEMSTYETAVALEGITHYMVASQASTVGRVSYDYDAFVSKLSKNPKMSGKELAKLICDTYRKDSLKTDSEYNSNKFPYPRVIEKVDDSKGYDNISSNMITVSVTDITKIPKLTAAYENFGNVLLKTAGDFQNNFLSLAPMAIKNVEKYSKTMVDLKYFVANFGNIFPETSNESAQLLKALDKAVVYNLRGDGKGYYATRYPNGGGLSTYYPLVLATQRDNISSYGKLGDLAPESIKRLYDEMQKYAPTTEPKKPSGETKPPGDKTDMADSSKANRDRYDLSDFSEIKPEVDYVAKTASIQLDKTQLERISGVRCQVVWFRYYEDENLTENIEAIFLGGDTGIRENWKTGKFESTFSGKWLKINGQPVFVQVVTDTTKKDRRGNMTGYEIYAVPIILNDRPCTLNISCEYPTETYRILSAQPDSDSDIPVDEIYGLNKGDVVRPVYLHIKVSEEDDLPDPENATQSEVADSLKDKISWVAGNPFTIGDSVKVEKNALPNGKYAYIFELVNPVGGANGLTEPVVFFVKNGKISSTENTEDIEPEPLED